MKKVLMLCAVVAFALGCTKSGLEISNNKSLKVSCSFDSYGSSENSAGFEKSKDPVGPAGSRITDTAFEVEDEIGIYVHTDLAVQNPPAGNHSSNMRYIFKGENIWQSSSSLSGELIQPAYNATGYYPYKGTITNPHAVAHSVESDQSTHAAMSRSDFARAVSALVNPNSDSPTLDFSGAASFKHLMSKLRVKAAIPTEVDGVKVVDIESIIIGGLKNGCTVNLADGVVTLNTSAVATEMIPNEITAGGAGSVGEWEAIVVPQSVAVGVDLVTITLNMVGGSTKELKYTVAEGEAFDKLTSGARVTLTLGNSADLAFANVSQLDLVDGLAKTGGKFSVKAPSGTTWSVASSQTWLTLSNNSNIAGDGTPQEVTFAIALNNSEKIRTANLTLSAAVNGSTESTITITQNYYSMTIPVDPNAVTAGQQSIVVGAITSNQLWYLSSSSTSQWLKLATTSTHSSSNGFRFPATAPDKHIGSLVANELFYQLDVNNSASTRSSVVTFTPDDGSTTNKTITQAAPVLTLDETAQSVAPHITTATFQVKGVANQQGVTYTPSKSTNATSIDPSVLQAIPSASAYSKDIKVGFAANSGAARAIKAKITYKGGTELEHTITQAAAALTISSSAKDVGVDVTASAFTLSSNVPYSSTYTTGGSATNGSSTISELPYTNRAITFKYPAQGANAAVERTHTMTITPNPNNSASSQTRVFTVTQAARPCALAISADKPGETVPKAGKAYTITLTTNSSWSVTDKTNVTVTTESGGTPSYLAPATGKIKLKITVASTSSNSTRTVSCKFNTTHASLTNATKTWSGTQEAASPPPIPGGVWDSKSKLYWATGNLTTSGTIGSSTSYGGYWTFDQAKSQCQRLGGKWRLPSRNEFVALFNNMSGDSWSNTGGFSFVSSSAYKSSLPLRFPAAGRDGGTAAGTHGYYWSSAEYNSSYGYHLSFSASNVNPQIYNTKTTTRSVRCVSPPPPIPGGVWDSYSRLHWATGNLTTSGTIGSPTSNGGYWNFNEAKTKCQGLGGKWRLPTRNEFAALFNGYGGGNSWSSTGGFSWSSSSAYKSSLPLRFPAAGSSGGSGAGTRGLYWSSTEHSSTHGCYLYFITGYVLPQGNDRKTNNFSVRCVSE